MHAVIHSLQQAFSQQSSGAAASRSRSHSSATNSSGGWGERESMVDDVNEKDRS